MKSNIHNFKTNYSWQNQYSDHFVGQGLYVASSPFQRTIPNEIVTVDHEIKSEAGLCTDHFTRSRDQKKLSFPQLTPFPTLNRGLCLIKSWWTNSLLSTVVLCLTKSWWPNFLLSTVVLCLTKSWWTSSLLLAVVLCLTKSWRTNFLPWTVGLSLTKSWWTNSLFWTVGLFLTKF